MILAWASPFNYYQKYIKHNLLCISATTSIWYLYVCDSGDI